MKLLAASGLLCCALSSRAAPAALDVRHADADRAHMADFMRAAFEIPAAANASVSDKVTSHAYESMYARFLVPLAAAARAHGRRIKLLEIGLGCDMVYKQPGASALLWSTLFPRDASELWMAEYDGHCATKLGPELARAGVRVLVGDQADRNVLDRWIAESGGAFDVIIDDGGHTNRMIDTSFRTLWSHLKPGGLYIFEDLHVGRSQRAMDGGAELIWADVLHAWSEQLLTSALRLSPWPKPARPGSATQHAASLAQRFPLPVHMDFVHVIREAAVVGKLTRAGGAAVKTHASIKDMGGGPLSALGTKQQAVLHAMAAAYAAEGKPRASSSGGHAKRPNMPHATATRHENNTAHLARPCKATVNDALAASLRLPMPSSYTNRWWSQQGEDEFFLKYFKTERDAQLGQASVLGTYVELGANDGSEASNTRRLYEAHGWRGLLVEASPPLCEKLAKNRPGDVVLCGAVCDLAFGGQLQFITTDRGAGTLVGHALDQGADPKWSAMVRGLHHSMATVSVPCAPFASMLASSGVSYADLFSLDVEQNELRVLKTINFSTFRFAVGFIELECPGAANSLSVQDEEVRALLTSHGYTYLMRQRGNDVWIDERVPWARRGAALVKAALREHSMPEHMIDRKCCGGRGAIDRTRCGAASVAPRGSDASRRSGAAPRTPYQRTAGHSTAQPRDAHSKFNGGHHTAQAEAPRVGKRRGEAEPKSPGSGTHSFFWSWWHG